MEQTEPAGASQDAGVAPDAANHQGKRRHLIADVEAAAPSSILSYASFAVCLIDELIDIKPQYQPGDVVWARLRGYPVRMYREDPALGRDMNSIHCTGM